MGDVIGVGLLVGLPLAIFIWLQWRREEADRRQADQRDPPDRSHGPDSHWGGMGRPGGPGG